MVIPTQGTTGNIKYFKFRVKPRVRYQSQSAPQVPGTVPNETGPSDASSGAYGRYNVDPRVPLWLLISSTDLILSMYISNVMLSGVMVWANQNYIKFQKK